jgi:DNA-binding response OmpR family regulator
MSFHTAHDSGALDAVLPETLRRRVAVLTDDDALYARLCDCLGALDVRWLSWPSCAELAQQAIDLVIVDAEDLKIDRWALGGLRERGPKHAPSVFALATWADPARAARWLNAGVDDLVFGPLEPQEFRARVLAVLRHRHARSSSSERLQLAGFELDRRREILADQGKPVELTRREFALAWLFFSQPNTVLSRGHISHAVWGAEPELAGRTMEQHIYRMRAKLQLNELRGVVVRSIYAQGYRLELNGHSLKFT